MPPAWKHRAFRLFWTGNALSLVGTLAQDAGRGWLVRTLTSDPFTLTAVAACATLPILFLTLYTGAVADRIDRRRALIFTNGAQLVLALILFGLVVSGLIQVWHVAILSLLMGTAQAFDIPSRQSMNIEMVGREDLPNAIALNSSAFNGARAIGPAVGGQLIHFFGIANCFLLNAFTYLPMLFNLHRMKAELALVEREKRRATLSDVREGFEWVKNHGALLPLIGLTGATSVFAFSHGSLLPLYASDVLKTDARGFSLLLTCAGAGAMGAALKTSLFGSHRSGPVRLFGGALMAQMSIAALGIAPSLPVAGALLVLGGYSQLTFLMTANTWIQTLAPDNLRGRVFSLYSLSLVGAMPVGALWIGALAKFTSVRDAIAFSAMLAIAWTFATLLSCRALRELE